MCRTENFYVLYLGLQKGKAIATEELYLCVQGLKQVLQGYLYLTLLCTIYCGLGVNSLLMYIEPQIIQNCLL